MTDTGERILTSALRLFARDGYEAVTVSAIAGDVGITKGALYRHYKNKRDIFDSIVGRMVRTDAERAGRFELPQERREDAPQSYERLSVRSVAEYTLSQFSFWTEDPFASDFRKMLALERYRNAEAAKLYEDCFTLGPVSYVADIFRSMIGEGVLAESDPEQLALAYYSPLFLLVEASSGGKDREELLGLLKRHIDCFFRRNGVGGEV